MGITGSEVVKCVGGYYKCLGGAKLGRKGYVPVKVGMDEESSRRFMVETKALRDARFCELLSKSAEELGFYNDGVLRILSEPHDFELCFLKYSTTTSIRPRPPPLFLHLFKKFGVL
ncbi:uncharacterized protein LOC129290933 [Prosopis cineraria]|uniref:uncharacterized protein LOC129290933 n=1 Tax=Prosopis cineraria TaxID=364024 RepID=UPI00240EB271|nr:uncharacterized protein LOC129290933 [Prosopis cineraria]